MLSTPGEQQSMTHGGLHLPGFHSPAFVSGHRSCSLLNLAHRVSPVARLGQTLTDITVHKFSVTLSEK